MIAASRLSRIFAVLIALALLNDGLMYVAAWANILLASRDAMINAAPIADRPPHNAYQAAAAAQNAAARYGVSVASCSLTDRALRVTLAQPVGSLFTVDALTRVPSEWLPAWLRERPHIEYEVTQPLDYGGDHAGATGAL